VAVKQCKMLRMEEREGVAKRLQHYGEWRSCGAEIIGFAIGDFEVYGRGPCPSPRV